MVSLNKVGVEGIPRPRPIASPIGTGGYSPVGGQGKIVPIEELEAHQLNGNGPMQRSTHSLPMSPEPATGNRRDSWSSRGNPEGGNPVQKDVDARRLSSASLASVPEGRKVAPRPPPKPKKSVVATGPLFEDEGEDGTEV